MKGKRELYLIPSGDQKGKISKVVIANVATVLVVKLLGGHSFPMGSICYHSVEYSKQFTHAGSEGDFLWFSCRNQALIKCFDDRVTASGRQGTHVKYRSNGGTATPDQALASECAAIPVKRGHSYQGSDLFSIERAKLRQSSQKAQ